MQSKKHWAVLMICLCLVCLSALFAFAACGKGAQTEDPNDPAIEQPGDGEGETPGAGDDSDKEPGSDDETPGENPGGGDPSGDTATYYEIRFYDYDGITLLGTARFEEGTKIEFAGETPERAATAQYEFTFAGWSSELGGSAEESITAESNANVYAVYSQALRSYTIYFEDGEGVVQQTSCEYGEIPAFEGEIAAVSATEMLDSVPVGWESGGIFYPLEESLPAVVGEARYSAVMGYALKEEGGTSDNAYKISESADIAFLADAVSQGEDFQGIYFELTQDLNLDGHTPIGNADHAFSGNIDGGGHVVTYSCEGEFDYAGLFGNFAGNLADMTVAADVRGGSVSGGIAAMNSGSISECEVRGAVRGMDAVGGIAGKNSGGISLCKASALIYKEGELAMAEPVGTGAGVFAGTAEEGHSIVYSRSVWSGEAASSFSSGEGTQEAPYVIASAEELAYLKDSAAENSYYADAHFIMTVSPDLNGIAWSGIGGGTSATAFGGIFDGNGNTIYNLNIVVSGGRQGLFNSASGKISDLTVMGKAEGGSASNNYVGLLVGMNYAEIENCAAVANIDTAAQNVGALIGCNGGKNITASAAYGYVKATNAVGGITGYNYKNGGAIGDIIDCTNYANISIGAASLTNNGGAGGIAGLCGSDALFEGCVNYGSVRGTSETGCGVGGIVGNNFVTQIRECSNYGSVSGGDYVGGVVGYLRNGGTVVGCASGGTVQGSRYAGGIVGCCALGASTGENASYVQECSFNGTVAGTEGVGGIVGYDSGAAVSDCSLDGTVTGTENVGGIVGYCNGATVSDCSAAGKVSGGFAVAGISGYNRGTVSGCENSAQVFVSENGAGYWIGGIVGMNGSSCPVTDCTNSGRITGIGGEKGGVGGIVGSNYGSVVSGCENTGDVAGLYRVGGIVGYAQASGGEVTECTNRAVVSTSATEGTVSVGCIVGYNLGKVTYCDNYGSYLAAGDECDMIGYIVGYDTVGETGVYENVNHAE